MVPSWYHRRGYVNTMAELILDDLAKFNAEQMQEGVHVLFSAHGVPESYIVAGDPYKRQIEECVRLIASQVTRLIENGSLAKRFGAPTSKFENAAKPFPSQFDETNNVMKDSGTGNEISSRIHYHLSFQSRVGPVQWLQPYTEEVIPQLGKEGVKNLVAVPVSFVSEHIETLEEMDMEYRELAEENGIENWRRTPAVNTDARFIDDMAELVVESLQSPVLSLSEAMQTMDLMEDGTAGPMQSLKNNGLSSETMNDLNSRVAMLGVLGTSVAEFLSGHHPIVHVVGMK